MRPVTVPLVLLLLASTGARADLMLPGDAARGKQLHAANCSGCHGTEVYTRKDRLIGSIGGLQKRVQGCNTQLQRNLNDGQLKDLVKYLNEGYYKFQ
jgi:mono/diheme cytochrome c family protein